ncbi:MAG: RNA polymerase subunit sigma [Planctomycetes bacterium]|nr:RNA polymerase subunit sigma [Planctomycetota bacterium]
MTEPRRDPQHTEANATAARDLAVAALYGEIRRIARNLMREERSNHTLAPTALANEAWLRLFGDGPLTFANDGEFLAAAVSALRRVLVEHGRRRAAHKRGGGRIEPLLQPDQVHAPVADERLLALEEALTQLAEFDPGKAKLVELRFFGGMSVDEAARVLGLSPRTVARDWRVAQAFLNARLRGSDDLDD